MRCFLRIYLAIVSNRLNGYVNRVFVAKLEQTIDLVKNTAKNFDILIVSVIRVFKANTPRISVHGP